MPGDDLLDPLPVNFGHGRGPRRLKECLGTDHPLLRLVEAVIAAEMAGNQFEIGVPVNQGTQMARRSALVRGLIGTRADVRDHWESGARQSADDVSHARVRERQVLKQRMELDSDDAVVAEVAQVLLNGELRMNRPKRDEPIAGH